MMFYLCLSFSVLWLVVIGYLFRLDGQVRDIRRRLAARQGHGEDS